MTDNVVRLPAAEPATEIAPVLSGMGEREGPSIPAPVRWPSGFEARPDGLYFVGDGKSSPLRLTGPFTLLGFGRNTKGHSWSLYLQWNDDDGHLHRGFTQRSELLSTGADAFKPLMSAGLDIRPGMLELKLLRKALAGVDCPGRIRLVSRTGWYEGAFVLPTQIIGTVPGEQPIFDGQADVARYGTSGSLAQRIEAVAKPAAGNTRLILALCAAFEGPLGELLQEEGGGLHFVGSSSIGKTTLLRVAGSVWGGGRNGFPQTWRTTDNALEGIARAHSGTLLALDEIGELDPRKAGEVAYMLINGQAKGRMRADNQLRERAEFRVMVLSSGEQSLEEKIAEAGHKPKAGQLLRVIDIPADAGCGLGLFEDLKGTEAGAFARSLKEASNQFYGTAGPAFVEALTANRASAAAVARVLTAKIKRKLLGFRPDAAGQIQRVAARLALIAAAGELAQKALDLPWSEQECEQAATVCFTAWLEHRGGTGSGELVSARVALREAIERDGEGRFRNQDAEFTSQLPMRDLLGYRKKHEEELLWCFTSTGLRHVLRGIAKLSDVVADLDAAGLLVSSPSDRSRRFSLKVDGRTVHTYAIRHALVSGDESS